MLSLRRRAVTEGPVPGGSTGAIDVLRLRVSAGLVPDDPNELPPRCRRAIAVATAAGAPLLGAIDAARAAEDDVLEAGRAVAVASAQARMVAGGLVLAPVVLVPGLGRIVDADLLAFYSTSLGLLILAVGVGLLVLGALTIRVLVRRVGRSRPAASPNPRVAMLAAGAAAFLAWRTLGFLLAPPTFLVVQHLARRMRDDPAETVDVDEAVDLTAIAVSGGVSVAEALRLAAAHMPEVRSRLRRLAFGLELGTAAASPSVPQRTGGKRSASREVPSGDPFARFTVLLVSAAEVGAPLAPSLTRLARDLRAEQLARVLAAAERLPAQLTFPTALCLLPATVLLVAAPIVHAGLLAAGTR